MPPPSRYDYHWRYAGHEKGSWFLSYEIKYNDPTNNECIELIRALVYEEWELKKRLAEEEDCPHSVQLRLNAVQRDLSFFRKKAVFYKEYSSLYNLALLGADWFKQQKRDLPEATFYTTIMCEKSEVNKDGFYSNLKPHHKYTVESFSYTDAPNYQKQPGIAEVGPWVYDIDLQLDQPLCIAIDYNDKIQPMAVGQIDEAQRRMNTVKEFFVKYERKLENLCDDFCEYYKGFPMQKVIFYYDHTAVNNHYASNDGRDFSWIIENQLRSHGWWVVPVYIGHAWKHIEKMLLINRAFDGRTRLTPFFNAKNCPNLLISIKNAGMYNGKKDKRDEKDRETQENLLEHRTDFSDAWDTLYIGCEQFPQMSYQFSGTGSYIQR